MQPFLPAQDPNPTARAEALEADRQRYRYDRSLGGLPLTAEVPKGENYSVEYMLRAAKGEATLLANRARGAVDPRLADERAAHDNAMAEAEGGGFTALKARFEQAKATGLITAPLEHASDLGDYEALVHVVPTPASKAVWKQDAFLAWQRVAGCNPAYIRQYTQDDPRLGVTREHFAAAVANPDDSLQRALSEGRLFVLDHRSLEGTPTNPSFGFDRYVAAPIGLFVRTLDGPLAPVAIQVGPTLGDAIATPADGALWQSAKNVLQTADAARQGLSEHLGQCHVFANAVLMCTARELAASHPLRILLWPHFEMTLAANESMKTMVLGEAGFVDQLQGPALAAGIAMAGDAQRTRSIRDHALHRDLELRGVADPETLPEYPYRDDAILVEAAQRRWVDAYLRLYYTSDSGLAADTELAAWYASLTDPQGGDLCDPHPIDTIAGLVDLVTAMIFRITAYHAVINYGGYDFFAWAPNLPTSRWSPVPQPGETVDEAALLQALPPLYMAEHTLDLFLPQRELRLNTLGQYPRGWFTDPRVAPILGAYQDRLSEADSAIADRDAQRRYPFPYLRPTRIAQSIHV